MGASGFGRSGTSARSRSPFPPAKMIACMALSIDRIDDAANLVDLLNAQIGKITDVEAEEMDVIGLGKVLVVLDRDDRFQIGLAKLIAAARASSPEFDAGLAECPHEPLSVVEVGFANYQ